jgi:hypothetical protein
VASQLEFVITLDLLWLLYDCSYNSVDFWFTVVLDPAIYENASGGAAWFPHYISRRPKYAIGENPHFSPNHGR